MWRRLLLTALLVSAGTIALACESVTHANDYGTAAGSVDTCGSVGTLLCNGACIAEDQKNCGGCGVPCESTQVCSSGKCGSQCNGGTTQCGNTCVDLQNDPDNCGFCGGPPDGGACIVCQAGKCRNDCAKPATLCKARCVDFDNDPDNCGSCGHTCPTGQFCSKGQCGASCGPDETQCSGGSCVNTATDVDHCGDCNAQPCPAPAAHGDAVCFDSQCAVACDLGFTHCNGPGVTGVNSGASCANLLNDPNHCGVCEIACGPDHGCLLGKCNGNIGGGGGMP